MAYLSQKINSFQLPDVSYSAARPRLGYQLEYCYQEPKKTENLRTKTDSKNVIFVRFSSRKKGRKNMEGWRLMA